MFYYFCSLYVAITLYALRSHFFNHIPSSLSSICYLFFWRILLFFVYYYMPFRSKATGILPCHLYHLLFLSSYFHLSQLRFMAALSYMYLCIHVRNVSNSVIPTIVFCSSFRMPSQPLFLSSVLNFRASKITSKSLPTSCEMGLAHKVIPPCLILYLA